MAKYADRIKTRHPKLSENKLKLMEMTAQLDAVEHIQEHKSWKAELEKELEKLRSEYPLPICRIATVRLKLEFAEKHLAFMEEELKESFDEVEAAAA